IIFPQFSASTATSSSALASMRSAILSSALLRSDGVVRFHVAKARNATLTAPSTSDASDSGISAKGSPVAGLISSTYLPLLGATDAPPMKFSKRRIATPPAGSAVQPAPCHSARRDKGLQLL